MKKVNVILYVAILFLVGCKPPEPEAITDKTEGPVIEVSKSISKSIVLAENLNIPWAIEKINGIFYITERPGTIVKIENGKVTRQKVELEKQLSNAADAGLLGFVLSPKFQETNRAYAYYTYKDNAGQFNRIVILRLNNDVWKEDSVLLDKIPGGRVHHGGRLKIGPDNNLYATVGDAWESHLAQDVKALAGKILRLKLDGSIPNDNPFPNSYVYSYGHRNPEGLTWAQDGTMYASEHGNDANDEINLIKPGLNYGWRVIEGLERKEGMETPIFTSGSDTAWAPSGMGYKSGKLYVATLRREAIIEFDLETEKYRRVVTGLGRIRDIYIDEDNLYFITTNKDGRGIPRTGDDKLYQISLPSLN